MWDYKHIYCIPTLGPLCVYINSFLHLSLNNSLCTHTKYKISLTWQHNKVRIGPVQDKQMIKYLQLQLNISLYSKHIYFINNCLLSIIKNHTPVSHTWNAKPPLMPVLYFPIYILSSSPLSQTSIKWLLLHIPPHI